MSTVERARLRVQHPHTEPNKKMHQDAPTQDAHSNSTRMVCIRRSRYFLVKPILDWCLTLALMVVALPVMLCVAALIAIFDGRPVFYRQLRVGQSNRLFSIWKFRSMRRDAEKQTGPIWCAPNDARVTRLGRWLRATHLDELPQFFNVLAGDMCLIGPRPERPEFVENLIHDIQDYNLRHAVPPGITGLAQVRQGYDSTVGDVEKKVQLDIAYIESASPWQDVQILLWTVPYITREVLEYLGRRIGSQNRNAKPAETAVPVLSENASSLENEEALVGDIARAIAEQSELLSNSARPPMVIRPPKFLQSPPSEHRTHQDAENAE